MFKKRRLKEAYDRVFSEGHTVQADVDIVMHDILSKTFINRPINGDEIMRAEKEGCRKIGIHIHNMLKLDTDYFIDLDKKMEKKKKQGEEGIRI